jgi:hypothetical protein
MSDKDTNIEKVEESKSPEKELNRKKIKVAKFVFYAALFVYSLIMTSFFINNSDISAVLGDFGSVVSVLLKTIGIMGFKWLPIFSICGVIATVFEEKLGDFPNSFLVVVILITVTSSILFFI